MADTTIEWTDKVWNPVTGCSKVSPGCKLCYAERVFPRTAAGQRVPVNSAAGITARDPDPTRVEDFRQRVFTDVRTHEDRLDRPLHWRKPAKIFVNSMSDLFHEDVPFEFIDKVFAVMALCPQHTFQVLTKRADRMREYFDDARVFNRIFETAITMGKLSGAVVAGMRGAMYLKNVWLGVSAEDQKRHDDRVLPLIQTPAAVHFVSYEPGLGPVEFTRLSGLDWVIVGGESGHGARPFELEWARSVIKQCRDAGVACFVKQLGKMPTDFSWFRPDWPEHVTYKNDPVHFFLIKLRDSHGGDINEWKKELQVREFPKP